MEKQSKSVGASGFGSPTKTRPTVKALNTTKDAPGKDEKGTGNFSLTNARKVASPQMLLRFFQSCQHALRREWHLMQSHVDGVEDGVGDRGCYRGA